MSGGISCWKHFGWLNPANDLDVDVGWQLSTAYSCPHAHAADQTCIPTVSFLSSLLVDHLLQLLNGPCLRARWTHLRHWFYFSKRHESRHLLGLRLEGRNLCLLGGFRDGWNLSSHSLVILGDLDVNWISVVRLRIKVYLKMAILTRRHAVRRLRTGEASHREF